MTKIGIKGVHPLADLFPMMSKQEQKALAEDIEANGQQELGKVTADGLLAEGRNRRAACDIAGIEFQYEVLNGDVNVGDMIVSANIFRRNMTKGQIAILAVCAELEIELPGKTPSPSDAVERRPATKKFDYRIQTRKRVENLVSPTVISEATDIVEWTPELAREILDTPGGKGWTAAREEAKRRRDDASTDERRREILAEEEPELLTQVDDEGGITLAEAWRLRESRIRQERETQSRLTGYFVEALRPLTGKSQQGIKELAEHYNPDYAHGVGIAALDESITYLQALRTEMKRQKKGSQ